MGKILQFARCQTFMPCPKKRGTSPELKETKPYTLTTFYLR